MTKILCITDIAEAREQLRPLLDDAVIVKEGDPVTITDIDCVVFYGTPGNRTDYYEYEVKPNCTQTASQFRISPVRKLENTGNVEHDLTLEYFKNNYEYPDLSLIGTESIVKAQLALTLAAQRKLGWLSYPQASYVKKLESAQRIAARKREATEHLRVDEKIDFTKAAAAAASNEYANITQ